METYNYRLYCTDCKSVTPHDFPNVENYKASDSIGTSFIKSLFNGLSGSMISGQAHRQCTHCGNEFDS
ncbi:hypothetical protein [Enterovibrio baiacu]|uniref:hypothetical protein n=1 Tax=Enterovibrio baiacu TaxID=2491023 RepID=UPI001012A752|nr:hypothetical protein [Enterovibrio baiacu]MBE1276675.1 hypothetical protein [Enterovibrio baiacu]